MRIAILFLTGLVQVIFRVVQATRTFSSPPNIAANSLLIILDRLNEYVDGSDDTPSRKSNIVDDTTWDGVPSAAYLELLHAQMNDRGSFLGVLQKFISKLQYCRSPVCILLLGDLYFQGLIIPNAIDPAINAALRIQEPLLSPNKNVLKAIQLWHEAADLGLSEAHFRLGVFYASYYNPPRYNFSPDILEARRKHQSSNLLYNTDSVDQNLKIETERFLLTLQTLDLTDLHPERNNYNGDVEKALASFWARRSNATCTPVHKAALEQLPLIRYDSLALTHFYIAAQGGFVPAQLALGFRHFHGLGTPRKCHAAAAYYGRIAQTVMAVSGTGVPPVGQLIRLNLPGSDLAGTNTQQKILDLQLHLAIDGNDSKAHLTLAKKHLLGSDGVAQNFSGALRHFISAARGNVREAYAWLGYMSALGLGVPIDLRMAETLFEAALLSPGFPLAANGLGYLQFVMHQNYTEAFRFFTASASKGFPDGAYNLGLCYLSGLGVTQSWRHAITHFTDALAAGHTGAAYMLATLHSNGIYAPRDCSIAATLFRRVATRHPWVAENLQKAHKLQSIGAPDEAAFILWNLAEAGVEIAQSNLAQLLDGGGLRPLILETASKTPVDYLRKILYKAKLLKTGYAPATLFAGWKRHSFGINTAFAERYWLLASEQRSTNAIVMLGEYAKKGLGTRLAELSEDEMQCATDLLGISGISNPAILDAENDSMTGWYRKKTAPTFAYRRVAPDYDAAAYYLDVASQIGTPQMIKQAEKDFEKKTTPAVILASVARAEFSLASMLQLGMGRFKKDLSTAYKKLYRMGKLDPSRAVSARILAFLFGAASLFDAVRSKSFLALLHGYGDSRLRTFLVCNVVFGLIVILRIIFRRTCRN